MAESNRPEHIHRTPRMSWVRQFFTWVGGALGAFGILTFLVWLLHAYLEARTVAYGFVSVVRAGAFSEARMVLTPDLARALDADVAVPSLLDEIAASDGALSTEQTGFSGDWTWIPFSCFSGELNPSARYWIVVTKAESGWRLTALTRNKRPMICEYDH